MFIWWLPLERGTQILTYFTNWSSWIWSLLVPEVFLLHLLPIRFGAFSKPSFSHCPDQCFLGDCRNTEFLSHLSWISRLSPVLSCWLCLKVPRITSPNKARNGSQRQTGKYCEPSWGRCEALHCQSGNSLSKMTVGGYWPALVLVKCDEASWDGVLWFFREGESVTNILRNLNCFIAAILHCCSIRSFPERGALCSLSTQQVQHGLMKTCTACRCHGF